MTRNVLFTICLLLIPFWILAQQKGRIVSITGNPISDVAVFYENSDLLTFTDEAGHFEIEKPSKNTPLYFYKMGYQPHSYFKSRKNQLDYIVMALQVHTDSENLFSTAPLDPFALFIVQAATKKRAQQDFNAYTVSYYAKGSLQLNTDRSRYLGQNRKDLNPALDTDSIHDNYFYLSEISSELTFKKPNASKEKVAGMKTSGNDNDLSYLTGTDANFNFYNAELAPNLKVVSPLSTSASSYYSFQLYHIFETESQHTVYQIKLTPKRSNEPVMDGFIYIVKDSWELYAVDVSIKGSNIGNDKVKVFNLQQFFEYNKDHQRWLKSKQILDLSSSYLVFSYMGSFTSTYTNYHPDATIKKEDFKRELIQFDSLYKTQNEDFWHSKRTIPLRYKETQKFNREAWIARYAPKPILDSIDKSLNAFTLFKLIKGYTYQNTSKQTHYVYQGLLSSFAFNPVQGFNVNTGLVYTKNRWDNRKTELGVVLNYGIEEQAARISGFASHVFNKTNYNTLHLSGGATIEQFGQEDAPIKNIINSMAGAWFGKNFAKYYQKNYLKIAYEQYAFTGLKWRSSFEYARRTPLFNGLSSPPFVPKLNFESNNPVDPLNFTEAPFKPHTLFKLKLGLDVVFDQKIISYPNHRHYMSNSKYPIVSFNLDKGLSSSESDYNYTFFSISTKYENSTGKFGHLSLGLDAGKFLESNNIAFMDYKHFNGNETFIGSSASYNKHFNLLPYYEYSTRKSYVQYHIEHDFRGFILNKIPLINQTRFSLLLGFHQLTIENKSPYQEISVGLNNVGIGNFRPFRIDYFRSHQNWGFRDQGVVIGIKVLDLIQK